MIVLLVPAAVALVGLLVYVLATNAKATELGRAMFWCGLFVVLLVLARDTIRL